jgi:hypothetical protein
MTLTGTAALTAGLDRLLAYRRFSEALAFTADGSAITRENAIAIWRAAAAWLEEHPTPAPT